MRCCTTLVEADLRFKHKQMKKSLNLFLRGTYYRWVQLWPDVCADLCDAPKVLAVGDLHVGSFGTWRDSEGRLSWGVDDFDESYPLPYTNDLVRLAASAKIGIESGDLTLKFKDGCDAILEGYRQTLWNGGCPIVLAEREQTLEKLGIDALKPPEDFWKKLSDRPAVRQGMPRDVRQALQKTLPAPSLDYKVVRRKAGLGSLGQQRFVAIVEWNGGHIAREAKAMVPSACLWLNGQVDHRRSFYQQAIESAVRSPDPFQRIHGRWLIRRLSPDSNPIEIEDLPQKRDEETLLCAMGSEAANVHLGSKRQLNRIVKDLACRKSGWLRSAGKDMAKVVENDWKAMQQ
jgi:Uncharacterized protein conserved in bacteria (DUF2252)